MSRKKKAFVVAGFNCGWVPLIVINATSKRAALAHLHTLDPRVRALGHDTQAVAPCADHYDKWFEIAKKNTMRAYGTESVEG